MTTTLRTQSIDPLEDITRSKAAMLVRLPLALVPASPARVLPPSAAAVPGVPHSYQCPASAVRYPVRGEKNRPATVRLPSHLLPDPSPRISTVCLHVGVVPGGAPPVKKALRIAKEIRRRDMRAAHIRTFLSVFDKKLDKQGLFLSNPLRGYSRHTPSRRLPQPCYSLRNPA